jgi:hypothetical protein
MECVDENRLTHLDRRNCAVSSHAPCMCRTHSERRHGRRCDVVLGAESRTRLTPEFLRVIYEGEYFQERNVEKDRMGSDLEWGRRMETRR